MDYRRKK